MTRIGDDTVSRFDHGRKSGIGVVATTLTSAVFHAARGMQLQASQSNDGILYVGNADVTADSADATSGFPLGPGEGLLVPIDDPRRVYVVADTTGQVVYWLSV